MGIHGLGPFLKRKAPEAFERTPAAALRGKHVAVDATLVIYSFIAKAFTTSINGVPDERLTDDPIFNEADRRSIVESAFNSIEWLISRMRRFGIIPILVFDGSAVPEKHSHARVRRAERRAAAVKSITALREQILDATPPDPILAAATNGSLAEDRRQLRTILKQATHMNPAADIARVRNFASDTLGVKCLDAPDEAERFCSFLAKSGRVAAAYTTDSDAIAFGAPLILTGLEADGFFAAIETPKILAALNLSHAQFVDLCILLGCDFNNSVPGIGPITAFELITAARDLHPRADRLIEHIVADATTTASAAAAADDVGKQKPPLRSSGGAPPRCKSKAAKAFASGTVVDDLAAERCRAIFLDRGGTLDEAVASVVLTDDAAPPPAFGSSAF